MGVHFQSNTSWRMVKRRGNSRARELPIYSEEWEGRYDQLATHLANYPVEMNYAGGYIVEHDIKDTAPKAGVEMFIAMPPNFDSYKLKKGTSRKVTTKSATITSGASAIISGADSIEATRTVSYDAPEARYSYFKATEPTAVTYGTTSGSIVVKRSVIIARATVDGVQVEKVYSGAVAPSPLVIALTMAIVDVAVLDAEQIPGTPWFSCNDVVTREFDGD